MKIKACLRCGSTNLKLAGMRDGITPGIEWSTTVCKDCQWQGIPLEFETEKAYRKFLEGLKQVTPSEEVPQTQDPAESAPVQRFVLRYVTAVFLMLLFIIIPLCVIAVFSVYGGLPIGVGFLFGGIAFLVYLYLFWKKEVWSLIKR